MESDRVHARAVIMRAAVNAERRRRRRGAAGWTGWRTAACPAITGVDTRALVRHIRDGGRHARRRLRRRDAGAAGARAGGRRAEHGRPRPRPRGHAREPEVHAPPDGAPAGGPRIAAIDTGIKGSIVRSFTARGARSSCTLHDAGRELLARDPDAFFLANGPGDPAALDYVVETVRELVGRKPVFGICLGHQLLCRAVGPGDLQAALRPPRRQPPGQGPPDRPDRDHLPEPRLRGRARRSARRRRRAGALGDRLRRRRADPRQPLRPHRRGPHGCSTSRPARPVPPRGRARARTTRLPVRPLPGRGSSAPRA